MQQSNAFLVGVGWNKRLLRYDIVSVLKFVTCSGVPGNTAALASVHPKSFDTEFPKIENMKYFLFSPTMKFQLLTIVNNNR